MDHALADEFLERFTIIPRASTGRPECGSGDEFGEKPGVEKMHYGVFDSTNINVNG